MARLFCLWWTHTFLPATVDLSGVLYAQKWPRAARECTYYVCNFWCYCSLALNVLFKCNIGYIFPPMQMSFVHHPLEPIYPHSNLILHKRWTLNEPDCTPSSQLEFLETSYIISLTESLDWSNVLWLVNASKTLNGHWMVFRSPILSPSLHDVRRSIPALDKIACQYLVSRSNVLDKVNRNEISVQFWIEKK